MLTLRKVAITGGLSSGKSTVCRFLAEEGAYVVSADEIVHSLFSSDQAVRQQVISLLGSDVLLNNQLSRDAIAKKVFSQPETLKSLEQIIHPAVFHEIQTRYENIKNNPDYDLFVAEVPLLYETESECRFDQVIVVLSDEKLCRERFSMKQRSSQDFTHRMLRQIPPEKKAARADFVILNNGTLEDLKNQVCKLIPKLRSI
jgi:dephospho-CoA kinase